MEVEYAFGSHQFTTGVNGGSSIVSFSSSNTMDRESGASHATSGFGSGDGSAPSDVDTPQQYGRLAPTPETSVASGSEHEDDDPFKTVRKPQSRIQNILSSLRDAKTPTVSVATESTESTADTVGFSGQLSPEVATSIRLTSGTVDM